MANTWSFTATWNTLRKSKNNSLNCAVPLGTASFFARKHRCKASLRECKGSLRDFAQVLTL